MDDTALVEKLLFDIISNYAKGTRRPISKVEYGAFSDQFERGSGLTLTLDNGNIVELLIIAPDR